MWTVKMKMTVFYLQSLLPAHPLCGLHVIFFPSVQLRSSKVTHQITIGERTALVSCFSKDTARFMRLSHGSGYKQ